MTSRVVRCGLIQAKNVVPVSSDLDKMNLNDQKAHLKKIKDAMIEKHIKLIESASDQGVKIVCLQEIFFGPYFCCENNPLWYQTAEPVPGPTTQIMQSLAKEKGIIIVLPVYEEVMTGVYYNTAVFIDGNGEILGKYRKTHIPDVLPGFFEKFYFKPGNLGYPVFKTDYGNIAAYICYDRHFPEVARLLGLHGAEIVFNPSATVAGLAQYLWKLEQPAHCVANGYFLGAINRVGTEEPWNIGKFFGNSYFCNPKGQIIVEAGEDNDEIVTADLNLDEIREVRDTWQFYRDRRVDIYGELTQQLP